MQFRFGGSLLLDEWFIVDTCEQMRELDKVAPKGHFWWFLTIRSHLSPCCFLLKAQLVTLGPHNTTSGHVASPITLFQFQFPYPAGLISITPILFNGDISNSQYLFKYQIEYILYIIYPSIYPFNGDISSSHDFFLYNTCMVLFLGCHPVIMSSWHSFVLYNLLHLQKMGNNYFSH